MSDEIEKKGELPETHLEPSPELVATAETPVTADVETRIALEGEGELAEPTPTEEKVLVVESPPRMETKRDLTNVQSLALLPIGMKALLNVNYSNVDYTMDDAGKRWAMEVQQALSTASDTSFLKTAERKEADWTQRPKHEGEVIVPGRPRVESGATGERISGERAIMRVTSLMGLGDRIDIPLWHSGIWVTIRTPSDGALLELDRLIALEKVTLGRQTNGLVFSHSSVYIVNHIMNLFEDCIYTHSVRDVSNKELRGLIKSTDIPLICWGLMTAIYPKGYPYSHPCMVNPDQCQHVTKAILSIAKLLWVDNDKLNDEQRELMVSRNKPRTTEQVVKYQTSGKQFAPREFPLNESVSMWLKVPDIESYIESGFAWVEGITRMVEGTFSTKLRGAERDKYISDQGVLSAMNQYCHWVSKIVTVDGEIIDDENTIRDLLKQMSADEDFTGKFFEAIGEYIEHVTVAIIAIDNFDCPACGTDQGKESPYKYLIPLDAMQTFFTLQAQRLSWALPQS